MKASTISSNKTIVGIAVAVTLFIGYSALAYISNTQHANTYVPTVHSFFTSRIIIWILTGIIALYARFVESQPLLLWKDLRYSFGFYIAAVLLLIVGLYVSMFIINIAFYALHESSNFTRLYQIKKLMMQSPALMWFTCVTAGITEELVFRGYLQSRLQLYFKAQVLPITITSILFGALHVSYGNILQIVGPTVTGFVFGWFYDKYQNIKILIVTHFLWDMLAMIALMYAHK